MAKGEDTNLARQLGAKLQEWRPAWEWRVIEDGPEMWIIYRPDDGRARWYKSNIYVCQLGLEDALILDAFVLQEIEGAVKMEAE